MKSKKEIEFWHKKTHYQVYGTKSSDGYIVVPTSVESLVHTNVHNNEYQLYKIRKLTKILLHKYLELKHSSPEWWNTQKKAANLVKLRALKKDWINGSNSIKFYKAQVRCARALEDKYKKDIKIDL